LGFSKAKFFSETVPGVLWPPMKAFFRSNLNENFILKLQDFRIHLEDRKLFKSIRKLTTTPKTALFFLLLPWKPSCVQELAKVKNIFAIFFFQKTTPYSAHPETL